MSVRRSELDRVGAGPTPVEIEPVRVDREHGPGGVTAAAASGVGAAFEIAEIAVPGSVLAGPVGSVLPAGIMLAGIVEGVAAAYETCEAHEAGARQSFMNAAFGATGGDRVVDAERVEPTLQRLQLQSQVEGGRARPRAA